MVKTTTVESFQAAQTDEQQPDRTGFDLGEFAQRMVRERQADDGHVGDPFEGMSLDVSPDDAFGLVEAQVMGWLEANNRWATPLEVRHKTDQLRAEAQNARPGPVQAATYTVEAGVVTSFTPDAPAAELPGMPARPAAVSGDVSMVLKVPSDSIFGDDGEYVMSGPLANRAQTLISRHPEHFDHLRRLSVLYLWKKSGGKSKGRVVFGKCTKPSGMLKHFSEADFVVWLAADHCRAAGYQDRQLEALLFHEMLHTGVSEVDENTGRGGGPTLVPHELEVFRAEVEIYGLWAADLKAIAPAFRQPSLFDGQPSDFERQEAAGAAYSDDESDDAPSTDAPLVCSVCGKPALDWEEELTPDEIAEARQNPAVVLCEACGEDGVIEGDE